MQIVPLHGGVEMLHGLIAVILYNLTLAYLLMSKNVAPIVALFLAIIPVAASLPIMHKFSFGSWKFWRD